VDFDYSFWNYSEGNLRISVVLKEKQYSKGVETEILSEIKKLAYEVNENKLVTARKALYKSANVFNYLTDVIDTMNWLSDKIGVGYDYEYLKKYQEVINNFKLETIKEEVVKFFKKEPDVVSVLNPKERE
jgi:predicted Zn-dependent peptidase